MYQVKRSSVHSTLLIIDILHPHSGNSRCASLAEWNMQSFYVINYFWWIRIRNSRSCILFTAEQSSFQLMRQSSTYCETVSHDGEGVFRPLSYLYSWLTYFQGGWSACLCKFVDVNLFLDGGSPLRFPVVVFLSQLRWTGKRLCTFKPPSSPWAGKQWTPWHSRWRRRLLLWTARPSKSTFPMRIRDLNTTRCCWQTQVRTRVNPGS